MRNARIIQNMPHIQVIQAQAVLADRNNYPEVIVYHASNIVKWSDEKRTAMQWLWLNRNLLRFWIEAKEGKSVIEKRRTASRKLAATISRTDLNNFYKAHKYLGDTKTSMAFAFGLFDALMKVLKCDDIALMHRYFACVNAKRMDSTLEPVAFLRWANGTATNEVLAWRMLRLATTRQPPHLNGGA